MSKIIQKNTLYIKSPNYDWFNLSQVAYDQYNWKPVLWTGMKNNKAILDQCDPHHANYYNQEDAMLGIAPSLPPHYKWQTIDAEILDDLSFHQPIVQEMLNRWFINPEAASFKSRSQYFNKLVEIWLNIFEAYKIDLVICPTVPHRVFDYIAYMIAQYKQVPYLMLEATAGIKNQNGDLVECMFAIDNLANRTSIISKEFEKNKTLLTITSNTSDYVKRIQSSYKEAKPKYLIEKENKLINENLFEKIKSYLPLHFKIWIKAFLKVITNKQSEKTTKCEFGNYFVTGQDLVHYSTKLKADLYNAKINKKMAHALKWYMQNSEELDINNQYVLFTASKQPERSTCPDAGHFYNHIDIIKTLIDALPPHYQIYYKEHPSNFRKPWVMDAQRSQSFYKNMLAIAPERIKFLKFDTDPFTAIDNATFVSSATGSSCWEAIIRGTPALIFGSTWYENCDGIFKFESIDSFRKDIKQIEKGVKPNFEEIQLYIEFMLQIDENLNWRRDENLGADNNDIKNPDYKNRVKMMAQSYFNGLKRYEQYQTKE